MQTDTPIGFCSQVDFDVNADPANLNIQSDVVKMIYANTERLISNNNILPAPGASVPFTSVSNAAGFHIANIGLKENNEALCDCKCFKSLKMCSHVLASAHLSGRLNEVVRYHRQKHLKRIGIDLFTMSVYTSRSGMKDNERKRV